MKRVVMIKGFDRMIIEKDFCPHLNVVRVDTGGMYTFAGEATDNAETFCQCLDCDQIQWDDGTWHDHQQEFKTQIEIPY
jgi:uncharacterized protein with PIN domain